ncbi:MAG: nucleotidyl transferase AbiEii/AbiGii toxin family protein [Dysgonamonadaceae bacterium]|jgi:predicted nucleotidyltransferase component of viral defense system|nr:nucleotidyl transferase AbiEii/AbiGii toxin family protein [Dysgonamonadaceae bacterium]
MINKIEINRLAAEKKVRASIIDKDWVLGHFVDAIFSIPECRRNLVFKGGTCLKKCRLPDYRFSEDLDFTAINADFLLDMPLLEKIVALVTERTEMLLHIHSLENLYFNDKLTGYTAQVKYWGAEHGKNQQPPEPLRWLTSVKIEVILYEKMLFAPEKATVIHNYSDKLTENSQNIPIYSIPEMLAEKLRALIQRSYTAPRDYYDIWYLSNNIENIDWKKVVWAFYEKSAYKNLHFASIEQFINPQNDKILRAAWRNSLSHQIEQEKLPEYETVRNDLLKFFKRILSC